MTPEQNWDGPIQDAIREWDIQQGHQPVTPIAFFQPPQRPTGGTVYLRPSDSGNPYARIDEDTSSPQPVVDVDLPEFPEETP